MCRARVPMWDNDRFIKPDIDACTALVSRYNILLHLELVFFFFFFAALKVLFADKFDSGAVWDAVRPFIESATSGPTQ